MTLRQLTWSGEPRADERLPRHQEWLVTNGLGGYASGTVEGICTRRYHGYLVAALPAPFGRTMMLDHLEEHLRLPGRETVRLSAEERPDQRVPTGRLPITELRLERGLPVWRYRMGEVELERRIVLPYRSNTVHLIYRLVEGPDHGVRLLLRPSMHIRPHEAPLAVAEPLRYELNVEERRIEVRGGELPPLRLLWQGQHGALVLDGGSTRELHYRTEHERGYDDSGPVWSPGYFRAELSAEREASLTASTDAWDAVLAVSPADALRTELERRGRLLAQAHPSARAGFGGELTLAADQFVIAPATRIGDAARVRAAGDEPRTVIAGYHWFTDWGRDTMISLEGLTLCTGRHAEAGYILRTFSQYIRDGLIPNHFQEGEREGLYNTADATLWYFHALARYLEASGDHTTLRLLLPALRSIVERHLEGTLFGIRVDAEDGLLVQGQRGLQLTWMDAKVGDWVVTPRRGKAVEINALWYNALRLMETWLGEERDPAGAGTMGTLAERVRASFNRRFWNPQAGCLYDVVDGEEGDDGSIRPNQLLAISLPHAVLDRARWDAVLEVTRRCLLTPVGLRTLAPQDPRYKPIYFGDLRARDAAYHQGTIWPWLIGPFVDAWLKVHPEASAEARDLLSGFADHLGEACVGSISEIFDADEPFAPRGCASQAWSVAEVLRAWVKTSPGS